MDFWYVYKFVVNKTNNESTVLYANQYEHCWLYKWARFPDQVTDAHPHMECHAKKQWNVWSVCFKLKEKSKLRIFIITEAANWMRFKQSIKILYASFNKTVRSDLNKISVEVA